jgi:hypothetical protein
MRGGSRWLRHIFEVVPFYQQGCRDIVVFALVGFGHAR